jgi:putative redox protein
VPGDKLEKAIKLSQDRYCGVTAMYRSFAPVTHEVVMEREPVR